MKKFAVIVCLFFPFFGLAEPVSKTTITVQNIPLLSIQEIQSKDLYTNALGTLEKHGVIGRYGFLSVDDAPQDIYFYMFFENTSDFWVNAGFSAKNIHSKKTLETSEAQGKFDSHLFSPLAPSTKKELLAFPYLGFQGGYIRPIKEGDTYNISLEVMRKPLLLQKYLSLRQDTLAKRIQANYQKDTSLSNSESDKLIDMLKLTTQLGFSFDALTQEACRNQPQLSIQKYQHGQDNIYIYSAVCVSGIGGEGTLDGKEYLTFFRLEGEKVISLFSINENGGRDNYLPSFYLIGDRTELAITDLDKNRNIEISLNRVEGLGSDQFLYEVVDGKLIKLIHVDAWSEGEVHSAAGCAVGKPFEDCDSW